MFHPKTASILGVETNLESEGRSRGAARWVKRQVIDRYDAYLVPQARSRDFVVSLSPRAATRPFLDFPNQVDPAVFRDGVDAARPRAEAVRRRFELGTEQLWVCPARLAPEKGLAPFLAAMRGLAGVRLVVAGDGPLRGELERQARASALPVTFVGNLAQAEMVELYAAADVFVLPSLSDPSPLSTIEACAAGLPLILSPRVGNFADVLEPGVNGWGLGLDEARDRALLAEVAGTPRAALRERGARSRLKFAARFDPDVCIGRLADDVVALVERKRGGLL
jgi:glycosyltransferase involved in cell wall biosynthesis